jgi:hypothetical protein
VAREEGDNDGRQVACHKKWIHQMETGDKNQKKSRERIINDRKMKKAHFIHKSP